jgi:hypothetical protein
VKSVNLTLFVSLPPVGFLFLAGLFCCAAALFDGARRAVGCSVPASAKVFFAAISVTLLECNRPRRRCAVSVGIHSSSAQPIFIGHCACVSRCVSAQSIEAKAPIGSLPDTRSTHAWNSPARLHPEPGCSTTASAYKRAAVKRKAVIIPFA